MRSFQCCAVRKPGLGKEPGSTVEDGGRRKTLLKRKSVEPICFTRYKALHLFFLLPPNGPLTPEQVIPPLPAFSKDTQLM